MLDCPFCQHSSQQQRHFQVIRRLTGRSNHLLHVPLVAHARGHKVRAPFEGSAMVETIREVVGMAIPHWKSGLPA